MSNQFKLCESCVVRHCNKMPTGKQTLLGASVPMWQCSKYRKHVEGFKVREIYYEKEEQYGRKA